MQTIYADYSISMSEFKKNPAQVLKTAGEKPVAVLNHRDALKTLAKLNLTGIKSMASQRISDPAAKGL